MSREEWLAKVKSEGAARRAAKRAARFGAFGIDIEIDLSPLDEIIREIQKISDVFLSGEIEKNIMPKALDLMVNSIKSNTPKDTGSLRYSMSSKVKSYNGGILVVGIVGADANYIGPKNRRPANYFHLVELGHNITIGNYVGMKHLNKMRNWLFKWRNTPVKTQWNSIRKEVEENERRVKGFVPGRYFALKAINSQKSQIQEIFRQGFEEILRKAQSGN
ncbi:MAG: HK97 gp10 family phage protein [Planctomycetaceae bacterium]|jgi:hypothetical protein|nr:HK97 gp10 family phage protein [Planctomycetaceae bacterium]